jgi:predicted acyl esterase
MFESYAPQMNAFNFAPPDASLTGARWADIWAERLQGSAPWSLGYLRHLRQGAYWQSRSLAPGYDRVQCPVYLIEGWPDWYASAELRAFQHLQVPKKVLIGPWGHYYPDEKGAFPGPCLDARREYLKWFDHWLKGVDTGVMSEPPVTVFVRHWQTPSLLCIEDAGTWHSFSAWPPPHVAPADFFLSTDGRLTDAAEPGEGAEVCMLRASVGLTTGRRGLGSTTPWAMPLDQRPDEACSVLFTTPPLPAPMQLLGEPVVTLYVSSSAPTAYFHVKICDVATDGTSRLITDGGLLASHRSSHERPTPLVPGEVVELTFPLKHCATVLAPGHRLRVAISNADFQNAWPTGTPASNRIHHGGRYRSSVRVPVAGAVRKPLAAPDFAPSPQATPPAEAIPCAGYALRWDLVADTVTCELASADAVATGWGNRSSYTVSNRTPAHASIVSSYAYRAPHPTLDIRVDATCQTVSDAASYTHTAQIEIRVDGALHFRKSWTESVPRGWS